MYCGSFPLGDMSCWKLEVFAKQCRLQVCLGTTDKYHWIGINLQVGDQKYWEASWTEGGQ